MPSVVIKKVDESPDVGFPALDGVSASGPVRTRSVMSGDRPLYLWIHELSPGGSIRWKSPKVGHVVYVWKGSITVAGKPFGAESAVIVEHKGGTAIEAGAGGATLVHYHQSEALPNMTAKAGGNVHLVDKNGIAIRDDVPRQTVHTVWADAHCPTCDLWLHRSSFRVSRPQAEPHMHNAHEIIFVTEGRTIVGKTHLPGTAIAVDAETIYGFGVDEGGAAFINFRPSNPMVRMTSKGKPRTDWMSEYDYMVKGESSPATRTAQAQ